MALSLTNLLQKTSIAVGPMLPETAHVQLLIALKCGDELLAVSKLCKTTVAAAVGAAAPGQYVPIVVSSMENTMVIAACSTNPELVGFTGFTNVTSDKSVAKTKGGGTDKTVEIDKDLQAKLHSVDMQNWAPPPDFKLPDGTAADAKLGPAARASLCFSVISDFLLLIGPYPSTGQKAQKQFIALRCGEVIPSSFLTPPTGHTKWDWGDEIWKWKAKGLINGGGAYHASVIVPVAHSTAAAGVALADGAVGDAILGAILTAQTRGGVRWTLSMHDNRVAKHRAKNVDQLLSLLHHYFGTRSLCKVSCKSCCVRRLLLCDPSCMLRRWTLMRLCIVNSVATRTATNRVVA